MASKAVGLVLLFLVCQQKHLKRMNSTTEPFGLPELSYYDCLFKK